MESRKKPPPPKKRAAKRAAQQAALPEDGHSVLDGDYPAYYQRVKTLRRHPAGWLDRLLMALAIVIADEQDLRRVVRSQIVAEEQQAVTSALTSALNQ